MVIIPYFRHSIVLCISFILLLQPLSASDLSIKKCFIVASYHDGFKGQQLKIKGFMDVLGDQCIIKQFNMDTKRNPDPEFCNKQARVALAEITKWKPDIIIAIDDNVSKYLIEPYLKDKEIPVIFCGLDWTAQEYGYPYSNATGIIEVFPILPLIKAIKQILPGANRAVCIRGNRLSEQKDYQRYKDVYSKFNIDVEDVIVETFDEFKTQFILAQQKDFIIFQNYSGIEGFNKEEAQKFMGEYCKKLVVSQLSWMAELSSLAVTQVIEEQGEYAAKYAQKILGGSSPQNLPISSNRKWELYANETLLKASSINLPTALKHKAKKLSFDLPNNQQKRKKCLFLGSYHRGYEWQDGIEQGLRITLGNSCKILQFNMNSKKRSSEKQLQTTALEAKYIIDLWKPDVIVASDDNASKFVIKPFYKDSTIPIVFCGVNWTAEEYGYPYSNVTGMLEVFPIPQLINYIRQINQSVKTGTCIYPATRSSIKTAKRYREIIKDLGISFALKQVSSMNEFEAAYIEAQQTDFILFMTNSGINDWNAERAQKLVQRHSAKLTTTINEWLMPYTMLGLTTVPEEQGEYAAQLALKLMDGASPSDFPIISNRKWNTFINKKLLDAAKITVPTPIRRRANSIDE